ncbi:hypothetical protein K8P03_05265 [Anaerococcus murdochii]|uniref:Uncharacterized protein n=1 Tax=Anaerococcus murdochii TaxID=411577 RepID=A0ABS7SYU2_9FIRM|nr:hypothetical protein [Anaerococcus murdochii]MBZ2386708.1 hypothetical protein [Anaerococcus murdochii]
MIINYKTKLDINGNTYNLSIDHSKKEFSHLMHLTNYGDITIIVTQKKIRELKSLLLKNDYKEV